VIAAGCLIFFLAASTIMVRSVDRLRPTVSGQDVLYFESPKAIKRASLGYTGLMACIYWTRVCNTSAVITIALPHITIFLLPCSRSPLISIPIW